MSMNYKSAKKRGMAGGGKKVRTLGSCMDQGTGAAGGFKYERLGASMAQGSNKRSFDKSKNKLGNAMNQ